jgi:hypothetical protein
MLVITPGGFERYFDRIAARITGVEPPPETEAAKPIPRWAHGRAALGLKQRSAEEETDTDG